jgi:hypothetical protein
MPSVRNLERPSEQESVLRSGLALGPELLGPESDHESALASVKATACQWVR